jgi:alginate O-acetyltransferase complex protein AlgI
MIFSSFAYVFFLAAMLAGLALIPFNPVKKALLLVGSYVFYACWDWRFLALMLALTLVNHHVGDRLARSADPAHNKRWLVGAVVFNLTVLGVFKYFNFFADSANVALQTLGVRVPLLEIILPVGISFITFEVMTYVIDVYRRTSPPAKSVWDLALLVAFFPHLLAGPILKPSHFLPQLERDIRIRWVNIEPGLQIFALGLVKKVVFADNLAPFADAVFQHPEQYSGSTLLLASVAYAIQIYCDFSGYSDMAIGSAKMMGFDIPRNFNLPYIGRSVTDAWRRWHISLTSWLREYLYFSLGGSRRGRLRKHLNQLVTIILGGLWHGAGWKFAFWGGIQGVAMMVHQEYHAVAQRYPVLNAWALAPVYWAMTFTFVCFSFVFFRAPDIETGALIVQKSIGLIDPAGVTWHATAAVWALPAMVLFHLYSERYGEYHHVRVFSFRGAFVLAFMLLAVLFLAPRAYSPFIYFQF